MFPMTITITIANTAQLNAVMSALSIEGATPAKEVAAAPVEKSKKQTPAPTPAATPAAPAPSSLTAEAAVGAAQEKTADDSAQPAASVASAAPASTAAGNAATYQDAAAAITKLSRTKGRDAAVAVLTSFGASKLPDVKPEQFADIIAAAEAALQG